MSRSKRKALIRVAERVALSVFALAVLSYGVLILGFQNRIQAADHSRVELLRQHQQMGKRVKRLKQFRASLPDARKVLEKFEQDRVPSRRQGYSRAAHTIHDIAQRSGVDISAVSFKLDSRHRDPMDRLGITLTAEGLYPSLIQFARKLETTSDFIVVRDFSLQQGDGSALALRLSADLYLSR
jgi:Tfp pilus assembly protein PilO